MAITEEWVTKTSCVVASDTKGDVTMPGLSDEQKRVVDDLLHHRQSGPNYTLTVSIHFSVQGKTWDERYQAHLPKAAALTRLLHDLFPHWIVSDFKEHRAFPGMWCAEIRATDKWLSLLASAYFERWGREGIMDKHGYGVCGGWDPRYDTARLRWQNVDPVQWVMETYGDTLENQFP